MFTGANSLCWFLFYYLIFIRWLLHVEKSETQRESMMLPVITDFSDSSLQNCILQYQPSGNQGIDWEKKHYYIQKYRETDKKYTMTRCPIKMVKYLVMTKYACISFFSIWQHLLENLKQMILNWAHATVFIIYIIDTATEYIFCRIYDLDLIIIIFFLASVSDKILTSPYAILFKTPRTRRSVLCRIQDKCHTTSLLCAL